VQRTINNIYYACNKYTSIIFYRKIKIERKERNENQIVDIEDSKIKVTSLGNETIAKARDTISSTINPKQMKIIDYMKDEKLFSNEDKEEAGFGLEEPSLPEKGKGLEPIQNNETKKVEPKKEEDLKVNIQDITYPYKLPPINLLSKSPSNIVSGEEATLKSKAIKLEQTLQNFGVNAKVLQVTKGPAITRYEIQPNVGVKVSSIVRLADDIALNLEAKSIRIEAPIPGKAAVGIEVENERVNLVTLRDILDSREFKTAKSKLTFAVGKDISGTPIVTDLKEMPHLLIAGSTGSGKSVCINSVIISILYRAKPDEVKFVLIDPKVVELCNYNGIPHLLIPVVTEPSKAAAALNWAVSEMTNRYQKFAEEGVRDLDSYNDSMRSKGEKNEVMPQIVIIIDELADLMMAAPSQVEESICRLAQMARAAGMHLIVATQRPSVDVITGVIKANVPSRISFAVSSQFDSRTILDMAGAEKLVGKGDMLFSPLGISKPIRVQGSFISDTEVHKVIDYIKKQVPENQYSDDVLQSIEKTYDSSADSDSDELLQDAIQTIIAAQTASVSMLQRRFRIGYNRAARLIDMMEARGIVGPSEGSKPRKVLMTEEQYSNLGKDQEER
jgi:S-DNA-T family DNA segregation ATPase FtsK/SpoIIIE